MKSSSRPRTRFAAWARACALIAVPLACHAPRPAQAPAVEPEIRATPAVRVDVPPDWMAEPLSWEKLGAIEAWLATDGRTSLPEWRIEGQLVLELGRLEFARREAQSTRDEAPPAALASRLRTVKAGLERVLADIDATPAQRQRATDGLGRAERLAARAPGEARGFGVPVIARASWGAMSAHTERMDKARGPYTRITVHHSADPDPVPLDGSSARTYEAVRDIQKAHMDGKSTHYGDIGYHFVIDPYGRVLQGRDLAFQGAHAYGDNNISNLGICLIGNFDEDKPSKAALDALRRMLDHMRKTYGIARDRVYGHRELRKTDCPGDNLMRWLEGYRK